MEHAGNWVQVCHKNDIDEEDVIRFDYGELTFAVYRSADDRYYATDGYCTHGKFHLANGLVMGNQIECPKHNGRFDYTSGAAKRAPVCVNIKTYPVKIDQDNIYIQTG